MKKFFNAIRKDDFNTVKELLNKHPELISCISTGTPKKDDGQSPLQVALKSSSEQIIDLLLERGADVNFIESEDSINSWRAPVIHDAINRAIMRSRWNVKRQDDLEIFSTKEESDKAFESLRKIILLGADVNAKDSYGNSCLNRACLQAKQILPTNESTDRVLTDELKEDIDRIFNLLIESGADVNYIAPNFNGKTCLETYCKEPLGMFLK